MAASKRILIVYLRREDTHEHISFRVALLQHAMAGVVPD
jgi:hypothetical protein